MITKRIIPCLDVKDCRVVKGVNFLGLRAVNSPVELSAYYSDCGADELVFYDIGASPQGRSVDYRWVERVSALLDIPFCVAGGIRSVATARAVLNAGADKVSINTPALERPALITELAEAFFVSRHHLSREFRRHTGTTVISYVNDLRVDQARRLLVETERPIGQIAEEVGFTTVTHFNRVFRERTGRTPRSIRSERPVGAAR